VLVGSNTGGQLTSGSYNVFVGSGVTGTNAGPGFSNTSGSYNVGLGSQALYNNTTASNNTAVGYQAGYSNTTGARNVFLGYQAGYTFTVGSTATYGSNVCLGASSGYSLTSGISNTLIGDQAGYSLTTGSANTFVGGGLYGTTGASGGAITTGSKNSILGNYSGNNGGLDIRTSNNYIVLSDGDGNPRGIFDNNGKLLVGQTSSGSGAIIQASSASGTEPVIQLNNTSTGNQGGFVSSFNTGAGSTSSFHFKGTSAGVGTWYLYGNGTTSFSSDLRLKKNVETTRDGYLEDLCKLRVVKYQWSANEDTSTKELGLIAQEVEQVFPSLIETTTDKIGEVENTKVLKASVLPFMLLKALQELKAEFDAYKASHP